MKGRTGDAPLVLKNLIDAVDGVDDELIRTKMSEEGLKEDVGVQVGEMRQVSPTFFSLWCLI